MSLSVRNIIRKSFRNEDKPKALSFFYDGYFDDYLVNNCNIELYGNILSAKYRWNPLEKTSINYIEESFATKEHDVDIDFVIGNMTYGNQLAAAQNLSRFYHVPLLILNHSRKPVLRDSIVNLGHFFMYSFKELEAVEKDIDILVAGYFSGNELGEIHTILGKIPKYNTVIWNMTNISNGWGQLDSLFNRAKTYLHVDSLGDIPYNNYRALYYKCGLVSIDMGEYNTVAGVHSNNMSTLANSLNRLLTNKQALEEAVLSGTKHWEEDIKDNTVKAKDRVTSILNDFKNKAFIL